jgi:hypothetical protein
VGNPGDYLRNDLEVPPVFRPPPAGES